jgi:hypothetical protein
MTAAIANTFKTRWATKDDLPALDELMKRAIDALQIGLLSREQIAASHAIMGLDTQLVEDGTYLVAERAGVIAGSGGWSRRATCTVEITASIFVIPNFSTLPMIRQGSGRCTPIRISPGKAWDV